MSEAADAAHAPRLPLSLILDDCAPINAAYFMHPEQEHVLSIPNSFADEFASVCESHGVRGKYSVLPMPSGAGRIDRRVSYVAPSDLERFLDIVRSRLTVRFDITAEILTHLAAYDIDNDRLLHRYEDEWIATASVAEMVRYISLALTILNNVGLPANGVTSCWRAGMGKEEQFARAIGEAQYAVNGRTFSWYFMHMDVRGRPRDPFVAWRDADRGIAVVSQPCGVADLLGRHPSEIDGIISSDGRSGRIPELIRYGQPVVMLTHWQSLFDDGSAAGLRDLDEVLKRIGRHYGGRLIWMRCSEIARTALERELS
ncbi:MAG: hypothetical protein OXC31_01575 [Spirochaetaceae bacterium]|nr:hypothetical protein [Spirochaetaceae bacterium]